MPHFSLPELIIIMVVVLLLFGAKRIPEIAGSMGRGIKEFKKQINDVEHDVSGRTASYPPPRLTSEDLRAPVPGAPITARDEVEPAEPKRLI